MKERFQIYRLAIPDIPAGQSVIALPLKLDSDAPFTIRALSFVNANNQIIAGVAPGHGVVGNDVFTLVRFKGPNGMYRQSDFTPASVLCPNSGAIGGFGCGTAWRPLYPETTYPANATIEIDVKNTSGHTLTGMAVLFRGVKQFPDSLDLVGASQYPAGSFTSTPYDLPRTHHLADVADVPNIALNAPADAPVVLRGGLLVLSSLAADSAGQLYVDLRCSIQDANHKAYMNEPIEVDWIFGANPSNIKRWFPQIWLPASGIMYYRFVRNDGGLGNLDFTVTWKGSKVFPK